MFRTVVFKIMLGLYFVLWSPILLIGLVSKRLIRFLITTCARGVLGLARIVAGIKYVIHFPPTEENGVPVAPNGNIRLDGKAIIAAKHMSILEIAILSTRVPNYFFIIKRELLWIPIYGWAFWRMGLQGVNRARGATNMHKLTSAVAKKNYGRNGSNYISRRNTCKTRPESSTAARPVVFSTRIKITDTARWDGRRSVLAKAWPYAQWNSKRMV